jgi:pyruvate-ferredoxin/flavodoxin oxidoreductase
VVRALFYGLGSDGTVGANKNSIKIIGEHTDNYAQGLLRLRLKEVGARSQFRICASDRSRFARHILLQVPISSRAISPSFSNATICCKNLAPGGTFLLNVPWPAQDVWKFMPPQLKKQLIEKQANFYVIDANQVAQSSGMGRRINTVMQVCFFALSGVLPREQAIEAIKDSIRRTYGKKGDEIVARNLQAVDNALAHLHKVEVPSNRVLAENADEPSKRIVGGTTSAGMSEGVGRGVVADGSIDKPIALGEGKDIRNGVVLPPAVAARCTSNLCAMCWAPSLWARRRTAGQRLAV